MLTGCCEVMSLKPPVASSRPSGENAIAEIISGWPVSLRSSFQVLASQK
jgi:hypothetical protein